MFPLEITFRDFESSEPIKQAAEKHAKKLEKHFDHIVSGHVILSAPHRHSHQGKIFHVNIQLKVPGSLLVVNHEPEKDHAHEDIYVTIRDSFDAMRRELDHYARKLNKSTEMRGHVTPPRGTVIKLFPERGYGFLEAEDGEEVYFHQNSVLNGKFKYLSIGDRVRYSFEMGDKGPQASSVALSNKKRHAEESTEDVYYGGEAI